MARVLVNGSPVSPRDLPVSVVIDGLGAGGNERLRFLFTASSVVVSLSAGGEAAGRHCQEYTEVAADLDERVVYRPSEEEE